MLTCSSFTFWAIPRIWAKGLIGFSTFLALMNTTHIWPQSFLIGVMFAIFPFGFLMADSTKRNKIIQLISLTIVGEGLKRFDMMNFKPPISTAMHTTVFIPFQCPFALPNPVGASIIIMAATPRRAIFTRPIIRIALPFVMTSFIAKIMIANSAWRSVQFLAAIITMNYSVESINPGGFSAPKPFHAIFTTKEVFETLSAKGRAHNFFATPRAFNHHFCRAGFTSTLNPTILLFWMFSLIRELFAALWACFCFHTVILPHPMIPSRVCLVYGQAQARLHRLRLERRVC